MVVACINRRVDQSTERARFPSEKVDQLSDAPSATT
ncbi:hypothetical protein NYA9BBAC_02629 [Salinibacterium sp. NYA9b]